MGLFGAFSLRNTTRPMHCAVVFFVFGPLLPHVGCRCVVCVVPLPRRAEIDIFYVKNDDFGLFSAKSDKKKYDFYPVARFLN